ncbi:MAG TPA: IS110 family transposase [Acidiferrobacterales bacterium]
MHQHTAIGIDLAKRVFQVCVVDTRHPGVRVNKELKRRELLDFMRHQPACRVYLEACAGAHYWARQFNALGHETKLMAPQFVTPFRKGHKTDANDALAIVEAGLRPTMRFVPRKGLAQQDLQSLHRVRERLIKQRTQLINQTHGLLQEYGIIAGRGQKALKQVLAQALEDAENELTMAMRALLAEQREELNRLNARLAELDQRVRQQAQALPPCRALQAIEGIGPIGATLLVAALGDGHVFANGRQAAAYLGLTPRQYSSGGKVTLIGIGRTGHPQLKATLIRGAHAVIKTLGDKPDPKSQWLRALVARAGANKAAVALANKTVRTAWAVLHHGTDYRRDYEHPRATAA